MKTRFRRHVVSCARQACQKAFLKRRSNHKHCSKACRFAAHYEKLPFSNPEESPPTKE